ncbi:hypothetical protein TNIN_459031 [Trichonephila inaurata madagascariensis]|uniref:Uncharacterized protein n=1 Tax=Trichonephila inaurata madagascariensis TaxID=2747483 RepID=A0A8X7BPY9_9ARAC|nr:hypothetical protein TNIN_459031 [Trichonephila inaurata madagascariensis]
MSGLEKGKGLGPPQGGSGEPQGPDFPPFSKTLRFWGPSFSVCGVYFSPSEDNAGLFRKSSRSISHYVTVSGFEDISVI